MYICGFLPTLTFTGPGFGTTPNIVPGCSVADGIVCANCLLYGEPIYGLFLSAILSAFAAAPAGDNNVDPPIVLTLALVATAEFNALVFNLSNDAARLFTAVSNAIAACASLKNDFSTIFPASAAAIISGVNNLNPAPPLNSCLRWNTPLIIYPRKFPRTPVSMMSGPANAVSPPRNVNNDLIGPGRFSVNLIIPLIVFSTNVLIFRN